VRETKKIRGAEVLLTFLFFLLHLILFFPAQSIAEEYSKEKGQSIEFKPKISGYIEGWYRYNYSDLSNQTVSAKKVNNEFRVRRARIDVKGNINEEVGYRVNGNFDGPSPASESASVKLWDGYINYKFHPLASITFGQFKYPFTLEGLESTRDRIPVLRAESINEIAGKLGTQGGGFRDIGVQVSGRYEKALDLKYAVAVINGSGINKGDNNNAKDFVGRIIFSPIEELTLGVSGYSGKGQDESVQTFEVNETAYGVEGEYILKGSGLSLRGEYLAADWENWNVITNSAEKGREQKPNGWYLQAAYEPIPSLNLQFMARYEDFERDSNTPDSHLKTTTMGATYYIKDKTRITVNYLIRKADVNSVVTAQETDATGGKIGNLFILQILVAY
jgi:phosphate-selective porin